MTIRQRSYDAWDLSYSTTKCSIIQNAFFLFLISFWDWKDVQIIRSIQLVTSLVTFHTWGQFGIFKTIEGLYFPTISCLTWLGKSIVQCLKQFVLHGLEKWTEAGRTTVSSGKQAAVSWKNLVAIFLSIFLSTPPVERGIEMTHYWKRAQLQNKIPQYQEETFYTHKKIFLNIAL